MDRQWEPVKVTDYFSLVRGREGNMASLEDGDVPLVSARNVNNGLKGFVGNPGRIVAGNVITLNNDGDGGAGLAYYQPVDMALDTHVTALVPREPLTPEAQMFTACCLSGLHEFFGHGRSISNGRTENIRVMLPVNTQGRPDWEYMEQTVKTMRIGLLARYKAYLQMQLLRLESKAIPALTDVEWKPVMISSFADVGSGRDIYEAERIPGDTPYITSGSQNNGVGYFVGNDNPTKDHDFIAINRNGAVGYAFYHPYDALMGNDCRRLHLKSTPDNLYIGEFIALCITKQRECFSYSRKLGTARANKMKVMLPVTPSGEPDWDYMEQYAKNMMKRKYEQYLAYLDSSKV